jgi:hypothetical protein
MQVENLSCLINNPVWVRDILRFFLSGVARAESGSIKFELIYLVMPLVSNENIFRKLAVSSTASTFVTVFDPPEVKNELVGMEAKISAFAQITNRGLVLLGREVAIDKLGQICVLSGSHYNEAVTELKIYYKAAYNLGVVFSKSNPRDIFLRIGASL